MNIPSFHLLMMKTQSLRPKIFPLKYDESSNEDGFLRKRDESVKLPRHTGNNLLLVNLKK